jgi:type IV pilus assembly protein PilQ
VWAFDLVLHQADLPETLRLLFQQMKQEVVISKSVQGLVTVQFTQSSLKQVLDSILVAHGLDKMKIGQVWWVAPQNEVIERRDALAKLGDKQEQAMPMRGNLWRIHYAKAKEIATFITSNGIGLMNTTSIKVDERTNTLYLFDRDKTIREVNRIIKQLDVPVPHVRVRARLVSLDDDMEKALGIQFSTDHEDKHELSKAIASEAGRFTFRIAKLAGHTSLDVKLSLLENEGRAELISSPSLYAASRESASIEAGEEVPYQESSENGGTTVVFKKAVLGLQVTPQVLPGKRILLKLKINQDRPGHQMVLGVPIITTRQIMTSVLMHDGETVVLGGIREQNLEVAEARLPWLSRLPVLGWLFKRENRQHARRELLIFVTPSIIS